MSVRSLLSRYASGVAVILVLGACGQQRAHEVQVPDVTQAEPAVMREKADMVVDSKISDESTPEPAAQEQKRYLALKYSLTVENEAETLEQSWKAVNERCRQLQCDILEGSFARSRDGSPPQGFLHVRIQPGKLAELLQATEQNGTVIANTMSSEDKTSQVVDTEARIKNMTELRDRLRLMVQNRSGPLKDVLEVERELANVQSQLDSYSGLRKALAEQTDKNEVTIQFVARSRFITAQKVSPLREAWDNVAEVFLNSISTLILFVAAIAPWLLALTPVIWFFRRCWRKRCERKAARQNQT